MTRLTSLLSHLRNALQICRRLAARAFVGVAGHWDWQAPAWMGWTGRHAARGWRVATATRPRGAALAGVVLAAAAAAAWWWTRPTPHYVTYAVTPPALTRYDERGVPAIEPLVVDFSESVAPLAQIERVVTSGVTLSPAIAGTWFWVSDRQLRFTPKDDWPIDVELAIGFARRRFFAEGTALEDYSTTARTAPFGVSIAESQFYQDPNDPNLKKLVATLAFTHPVDTARLESRISLEVAKDAAYLGLAPDSRHFTVAYDKLRLAAYVHSAALAMPRDDTPITLHVDRGVRAARGGNETDVPHQAVVVVPGRTSLRFSEARMTIVDNARYEPEQILLVASSSPVVERALAPAVSVRLLPVRGPRQPADDPDPYAWDDAEAIGADVLTTAPAVTLRYVPSEEGGNTSHGFAFHAPVGRYVHVTVKDGVQGVGGYVSGKPYAATVKVDPYPRALTFLGTGALLPLSGDRTIAFLARDVEAVDVEIGRVLPNQLHHLAPRMWNFAQPSLYDSIEDTIVERFTTTRDYKGTRPGKPTYDRVALGTYLDETAHGQRGLFLVHLRARGTLRADDAAEGGDEGDGESYDESRLEDTRLVLVTDLGVIVKDASDGTRDVFAQSIRTGLPVEGARIDLVGRNGLPMVSATTDATGHARLAKPAPEEARREKTPILIVAQRGADLSFLPLASGGRTLDFSRFDTGGVENARSAQQLSAYLFSDRGLYRPGETAHLGMLTRTADWKASLVGLPLHVDITDPRGLVVSRHELKLSASAFDEVTFATSAAAPTGTYQATAYLVQDARRREMLGSTSFRVQEFEPDRLKVRLDLSAARAEGWLRSADVAVGVEVAHLFGEAASGRRVEAELSVTAALPQFARYADYRFSAGTVLEPYQETLAAATTDNEGRARFALDLKRFAGRAYRVDVLARAFEAEGGRHVSVRNSAIVSDAPYLIGVKPDGELTFVRRTSTRHARWLAVNQHLQPVAAAGLTLEWVERRYVSVLTQQDNGTYKYVSRRRDIVRSSRKVDLPVAGGLLPLPTGEPGDFVLVLRTAEGAELNTLAYTVAGQANLTRSLERNAELQVQLDKAAYGGGDVVEVSIRAPYAGAGLITIERERVFHHQWFKTTTTSSVQRVVVPRDFEGNGYVSVQFLRDPSSSELFMSPLSYGVAPFGPDLSARTQTVTLAAPKVVKPGTTLTMRVAPGEASRVAVVAVDEGILQVARYRTPDPLAYFFQKRMLEVGTRQILDLILPDAERFIALATAPGGDAEGGFARQLNPFTRKRKAPVAFWSGLIDVGPEGRDVRYTVPDYFNGRLRLIAIVASPRRMGVAEAGVDVKGDFILTPNVPVAAVPGDEFLVSVGVFDNTSGGSAPVRVSVTPGPGLTIVGPGSVDLAIASKREGVAEFRLKAGATLGSASLTFAAARGPAQARNEEAISLRPAVAYRTQLTLGRIDGSSAAVPLTRDLYPERRTVDASVSSLPLVWGQGLTAYLDDYEYSCTEQLVSKGVAAILLTSRPEWGTTKSRDGQRLQGLFGTLRSRQNDQGGLGLWASTPVTAEFPTVYAAHVLVEAKDRRERIPADVLTAMNGWLERFAGTPASSLGDARLRAYAVYVLARQGIKADAAIANVEQELTHRYPDAWPTDLAAAYLASTYRLLQRTKDADRIIAQVPWAASRRGAAEEVYYDAVVHDAQLLYLQARHFPTRLTQAPPAVALEAMSAAISGQRVSSLSAAYTLLALDAYASAARGTATFTITAVGKDGREAPLALPAGTMPKVAVPIGTARLAIAKAGPLVGYYTVNESGFERTLPAAATSRGVEVIHEIVDRGGNPLAKLTVGQEAFVRIRVRATDRDQVPQVAVVDILPGGLEPVAETPVPAGSSADSADPALARRRVSFGTLPVGVAELSTWVPDHVDAREDRLVLYGAIGRDARAFTYRVRATNAGTFVVPPAFAEGMYNRTIAGISQAGTLEVVKR